MRMRQPTRVRKGPQEAFDIMAALRRYVSGLSTGGHLSREIASHFIDELDRAGGILLGRKDKAEGYQILEELSDYVADEASGELPEYIIEYLVEAIGDIIGNLRPVAKESSMKMRKPVGKAAGERPGHPTPEGHVFVDVGRGRSFYKRTYPRHIMEDIGIVYGVDEMAGDGVPAAYFFDKRYGWTAESAKEFCEDRSVNIAEGMDIIKGVVHLRRPFSKQDYSDFGRGGSARYRGDANKALFRFTRNVEDAGGGPFEFHDLMEFAPWVSETQMLEMIDRLKADGVLAQSKVGSRILFHIIGSQAAKNPIAARMTKMTAEKVAGAIYDWMRPGWKPQRLPWIQDRFDMIDSGMVAEAVRMLAEEGKLTESEKGYVVVKGMQKQGDDFRSITDMVTSLPGTEKRVRKQAYGRPNYYSTQGGDRPIAVFLDRIEEAGSGPFHFNMLSSFAPWADVAEMQRMIKRLEEDGVLVGTKVGKLVVWHVPGSQALKEPVEGRVGKAEDWYGWLAEFVQGLVADARESGENLVIDVDEVEAAYLEQGGHLTQDEKFMLFEEFKREMQNKGIKGMPGGDTTYYYHKRESSGNVGKQEPADIATIISVLTLADADSPETAIPWQEVMDKYEEIEQQGEGGALDADAALTYLVNEDIVGFENVEGGFWESTARYYLKKRGAVGKQSRQLVENVYRRLAWQLDGEAALEVLEAEMNQYPPKEVHRAIDVLVDEGRIEIAGDVVRVLAGVTKQTMTTEAENEKVYYAIRQAGKPIDHDYLVGVLPDLTLEQITHALTILSGVGLIQYRHPGTIEVTKQDKEPAFEEFWTEDIKDIILGLLECNEGKYVVYSKIVEAAIEMGIDDDATVMDMLTHLESQELIEGKHLEDEPAWRLVEEKKVGKRVKFKKRVPIMKIDAKHRVVYGVVYSPYEVDTQDDWSDEDEILKAVHYYMMHSQQIGKNHIEMMGGKAAVVECGYAHADWPPFRKGEWFMGTKILDDDEWRQVENGEITGYSMGGDGLRVERGIPAGSAA